MITLNYALARLAELELLDKDKMTEDELNEYENAIQVFRETVSVSADDTARALLMREAEYQALEDEINKLKYKASRMLATTCRIKRDILSWLNSKGVDTLEGDVYVFARTEDQQDIITYGPEVKPHESFDKDIAVEGDDLDDDYSLNDSDAIALRLNMRKKKCEILRTKAGELYKLAADMTKADEALKAAIIKTMRRNCVNKVKHGTYSISLRDIDVVAVDCKPEELPAKFQKVTIEPRKADIKAALAKGISVNGCRIERKQGLNVR